ncbi:MAG: hypothetical protein ACRD3W_32225 [Terriglobales bacterium]
MNSLASSQARGHTAPIINKVDRPASSRELVDEFIRVIRQGDLRMFMQYIHSFESDTKCLSEIVGVASRSVNRPECWIPNVIVATGSCKGKPIDRIQISFRVDRVKRILSVSSDPEVKPVVAGPRKDAVSTLPVVLPEDPHVLFRQVARLMSIPRIPAPPPLTTQ